MYSSFSSLFSFILLMEPRSHFHIVYVAGVARWWVIISQHFLILSDESCLHNIINETLTKNNQNIYFQFNKHVDWTLQFASPRDLKRRHSDENLLRWILNWIFWSDQTAHGRRWFVLYDWKSPTKFNEREKFSVYGLVTAFCFYLSPPKMGDRHCNKWPFRPEKFCLWREGAMGPTIGHGPKQL